MAGSIVMWYDGVPAQLHWDKHLDEWYITFLIVDQAAHMVPLLARFRKVWRDEGRPVIYFHCAPENEAMGRLCKLLGAVALGDDLHKLVSLERKGIMYEAGNTHILS